MTVTLNNPVVGASLAAASTSLVAMQEALALQNEILTPTGTTRANAAAISKPYTVIAVAGSGAVGVKLPAAIAPLTRVLVPRDPSHDIHVYALGSDTITVSDGTQSGVNAGATGITFGDESLFKYGVFTCTVDGNWDYTGFATNINGVQYPSLLEVMLLPVAIGFDSNDDPGA